MRPHIAAIIITTAKLVTAATAPDSCDPQVIQNCLAKFETKYSLCDESDSKCQCNLVITQGANCYSACPQDAMTRFIKTYGEGQCADFDPYLTRRADESNDEVEASADEQDKSENDQSNKRQKHNPEEGKDEESKNEASNVESNAGAEEHDDEGHDIQRSEEDLINEASEKDIQGFDSEVRAITVTPTDPTTTISLSPEEYQSRLEKSRIKANLRSIRSERARISEEAAARLAVPTGPSRVVRRESASYSESTSTSSSEHHSSEAASSPTQEASKPKETKEKAKSGAVSLRIYTTTWALAVTVGGAALLL